MKAKKILKALVAAAMLTAVTAAFFGAPTSLACRIQPAATVTFLVVLLLTPFAGRLFCECFCPLGIIQSFVNWIFHSKTKVRRVCTRLPESRQQRIVRWTSLVVAGVLIGSGLGAIGWLLTPYSIYGKALTLFVPGVAIFALVVALAAIGKGRIWCNWICPVGTLFNILSKKCVCAHKVGPGCSNCKACFTSMSTPKSQNHQTTEPSNHQTSFTRRDTLKGMTALAAAEAVEKTTDGGYASVSLPGVPTRPAQVLPPGSVDRREFNIKCVACGLCIANCRGGCLKPSVSLKRLGQPEMDFRHGYCLSGCAQQCAKVCPAGAIRLLDGVARKDIHAGHAIWKRDLCIRETEDVECTACSRKCPVDAIHIVEGFPVIDKGACIGCGACEHVCPARPMPAIFVKGFDSQRVVRPFNEKDLVAEMVSLLSRGEASCVSAKDGVIVGKATGKGISPLFGLLSEGKLTHALVADKVIGRAAAAICIVGNAKKVHALLMGADALTLLKTHGVEASAEKTVPKILNRDLTDGCPMEQTVDGIDDPAEMVKALKSRLGI
jgi:polyferredoxin